LKEDKYLKFEKIVAEALPGKGVYTLVIFLKKKLTIDVGKLGTFSFPSGYYLYTGSALGPSPNSLHRRIYRHLLKSKNRRWHIDYLTSNENVLIKAVVAAETSGRFECIINQMLREKMNGEILVDGFGASDCNQKCRSHLLYLGMKVDVEFNVISIYDKVFPQCTSALLFM